MNGGELNGNPSARLLETLTHVWKSRDTTISASLVTEFAGIEDRNQFTIDRKAARSDLAAAISMERKRQEAS